MKKASDKQRVFLPPVTLAMVTLVGLLAALIGGETFYPLTWLALGIPLVVILRYLVRGRGQE